MAGGSGTRFWPKSRKKYPKQLIDLLGSGSLITQTINRIKKVDSSENIYVVASQFLVDKIQKEIKDIPRSNYIIEPSAKNTAPAIGLAALHIYKKDPNGVMAVYPADHLINGVDDFVNSMKSAESFAEKESTLVTIGVEPNFPSTGYGYIQFGKKSILDKNIDIYRVKTFAEKPHREVAEKFFHSKEFLWNSGIFVWKAKKILQEMKIYMCELHQSLENIYDNLNSETYESTLIKEWQIIESESIDYGILEKSKDVFVVKGKFGWSDLGTWDSLFKTFKKNNQGSIHSGEVVTINSRNNLIFSPNRLTALIGIEKLVVINMDDATLIMPQSESENVKDIVKMLESMGKEKYL